ncbi:membrane protein required for colicin V production [Gillisia sp. Hel1_33_143]|uniref:CvpA family protein n=1 Tax=Gillisia sp. Hel1_33_143 TaxID=1336796 RepID=UPI0008792206|nr:CvpA family protein [Gillisia sp. Hel1_33_143]SDR82805.1 membrane protein required for colicin V production [Gillisia sp. Hel1_33_143]
MNIVDIVLAVLLLYGLVRGLFRGFLAELASLIAFVAGIYGAVYFSHNVSHYLSTITKWDSQLIHLFSFAITFILIAFTISWAGRALTKIANLVFLGLINKLLGAAFGIIKVAFITSVIIMFFSSTQEAFQIVDKETLDSSVLYRPVRTLAPALIPAIIQEAKDLNILNNEEEKEKDIQ